MASSTLVPSKNSSKLNRQLMIGFVVAVLGLVAIVIFLRTGIQELKMSGDQRSGLRVAAFELKSLMGLLADAETAQRGYLLTGDDQYLKPYFQAKVAVPEHFAKLEKFFSTQEENQKKLRDLNQLISKKFEEMARTIDFKRLNKSADAIKMVQTNLGLAQMDELRILTGEIEADLKTRIDQQSRQQDQIVSRATGVVFGGSTALFIVISILLFLLHKNQKRREQIEQSLREAHARSEKQKALFSKVISTQNRIATAAIDSAQLKDLVTRLSMELTGADGSLIEIIEGDDFVYHYVAGAASPFLGMKIKREGSFSGLCLKQQEPLICHDSEVDDRVNRDACRKVQLRSMIVTPLFHSGKTIGVLKNYSAQPYFFDEQTFGAMTLVTGLLSAALGQAQAFEEKTKAIRDLKKTQEELLISRDEAHAAAQTKSRFLANMSHEVRTPLNGILGMTDLMLDGLLPGEQREYARAIKTSGESLLHLVSDILDYSKIEAGRMDLELVNFDLASTLLDLKKTFSYAAQQKKLELILEIDPEIPGYVKGDPGRIRQVLVNLIGNAIKFTAEGDVRVRALCIGHEDGASHLRFDVFDSGIGIAPEVLGNLFKEFVQADASTTRRFGGSGLGLSICKYLVEQMGGTIGVDSELGKGSNFWFTLRLANGVQAEPKNAESDIQKIPARATPWRVLIAEDNTVNQVIISKMLGKLGLISEIAADGKAAVEALVEGNYDLVLMDCHMPEMDGYEATAYIRTNPKIKNHQIPIIAMTANAMKGDRERTIEAGMDDYMAKPLDIKKVQTVLAKWLQRLSNT